MTGFVWGALSGAGIAVFCIVVFTMLLRRASFAAEPVLCAGCAATHGMVGTSLLRDCAYCHKKDAASGSLQAVCDDCSARYGLCYQCGGKV